MATTLFDVRNKRPAFADLIADITHEWGGMDPSKQNIYTSTLSDTWTPTTGAVTLARNGGTPGLSVQADDGDGKQAIRQVNGTVLKATLSATGDFGAAIIWRRNGSSGSGTLFGFGDDAASSTQRLNLEVIGTTSVRAYYVNAAGSDAAAATDTYDAGTTWHIATVSRSGADVTLQIDDRAAVTGAISGTVNVLTRFNALGCNQAGTLLSGDQYSVRQIGLRVGTPWTAAERAALARFFLDQKAWFGT